MKWVADQCDLVKDVLPFRYSNENENWGRVNGAAAYALKARALLYRASPLNNPTNNIEWWKEAAEAARAFITRNNQQTKPYKLYRTSDNDPTQNYYQCFVTTPYFNDEYILTRSVWTTHTVEDYLAPAGFTNSSGRTNPTRNLVDSYETINGLPIDQDPSYDPQNPYADRDPRLEQTILHQGSIWGDKLNEEERAIDVSYPSGADYETQNGGTLTGYYTKKYLNNMSFKSPSNYNHVCPIFRFGEVLLNAAEAVNEAYGPSEAYQYINELRDRVGMPAYSGMNQNNSVNAFATNDVLNCALKTTVSSTNVAGSFLKPKHHPAKKKICHTTSRSIIFMVSLLQIRKMQCTHTALPEIIPHAHSMCLRITTSPIPDAETKRLPRLGQNQGWELSTSTGGDENDSNEETPAE